jgi:hypothetical protein
MTIFIYFRCAISSLAPQQGYELICCPYEESCYEKVDVSHLSFRQIQVATLNLSKKPKKAQQLPTQDEVCLC